MHAYFLGTAIGYCDYCCRYDYRYHESMHGSLLVRHLTLEVRVVLCNFGFLAFAFVNRQPAFQAGPDVLVAVWMQNPASQEVIQPLLETIEFLWRSLTLRLI